MTKPDRKEMFARARSALLTALPDAMAIYVYGSFARGDEWPSSDVDFAVLLPHGKDLGDKLKLMSDVSSRVGYRDVDIADLRRAGLDLVMEVLRHGITLHNATPDETLAWEAERMTDYGDFNRRRAALVDRYMRDPLLPSA